MKQLLILSNLLLCGCATTTKVVTSPIRALKKLFGGAEPVAEDPYAIWQEYAIYIVIAGIIIGVIDFAMDRKLTLIGPAIFACGLAVSIWGVTIGFIDTILPWVLGISVVGWVALHYYKKKNKRNT